MRKCRKKLDKSEKRQYSIPVKYHYEKRGGKMDANQLTERLTAFGLTRQEATVYLALFTAGTQTGYEVAKQTGISRSNAYNALAGLVDKGAAYPEEGTVTRYTAVDVSEFCRNKIETLKQLAEELASHMPKAKEEVEGYLTITGDGHIENKIKNMLLQAKQRVYLKAEHSVLEPFLPQLNSMCEAETKVVILTDQEKEMPSAAQIYVTQVKKNQVGVITDSTHVLTGEFGKGDDSSCLYTGQRNFVQIFKESLKNEIRLIELTKGEK